MTVIFWLLKKFSLLTITNFYSCLSTGFEFIRFLRSHIQEIILPDKGGSQPGFGITSLERGGILLSLPNCLPPVVPLIKGDGDRRGFIENWY